VTPHLTHLFSYSYQHTKVGGASHFERRAMSGKKMTDKGKGKKSFATALDSSTSDFPSDFPSAVLTPAFSLKSEPPSVIPTIIVTTVTYKATKSKSGGGKGMTMGNKGGKDRLLKKDSGMAGMMMSMTKHTAAPSFPRPIDSDPPSSIPTVVVTSTNAKTTIEPTSASTGGMMAKKMKSKGMSKGGMGKRRHRTDL